MPAPAKPRRSPVAGLVAGAIGSLAALTSIREVAQFPFGLVVIDAALAWGLASLARTLLAEDDPWDALVAALVPFLVTPFLARSVAYATGKILPLALRATILLEVIVLATALIGFVTLGRCLPERAVFALGAMGALIVVALVALLASKRPEPAVGNIVILAVALAVACALLAAQALGARRLGGNFATLASPVPLVVAAGQLLDGAVTYFSVVDPLGLASSNYHEQVALSALLLDTTGPGNVAAKWAIGLAAGYVIARDGEPERRFGFALALAFFGLQPAFFSGSQLL